MVHALTSEISDINSKTLDGNGETYFPEKVLIQPWKTELIEFHVD